MRRIPLLAVSAALLLAPGPSHASGVVSGGIATLSDPGATLSIVAGQGPGAGPSSTSLHYVCVVNRIPRLRIVQSGCGEVPPMRVLPDMSYARASGELVTDVISTRTGRHVGRDRLVFFVVWESPSSLGAPDRATACTGPGGASAVASRIRAATIAKATLISDNFGRWTFRNASSPVIFQTAAASGSVPAIARQCVGTA